MKRLSCAILLAAIAAAAAALSVDERERLHQLQKRLMNAQIEVLRAEREYEAGIAAARAKLHLPEGCVPDMMLQWQPADRCQEAPAK